MFVSINRVGLFWFNPSTGEINKIQEPTLSRLNSISNIKYIAHTGQILITQEGDDFIYVARKKGKELELVDYYSLQNTKVSTENNISVIYEDSKRNIWIGTGLGLYTKRFRGKIEKLSNMSQSIVTLHEDKEANLWIGAAKGGVFKTQIESPRIS